MKITAYHGTNCKIEKFNNNTTDETNKIKEIWFTTDIEVAIDYAKTRTNELGGKENVIKAIVNINNPMPLLLKDSIEQILTYATKEDELTEYEEMYNDFDGKETVEFAEYVTHEKYQETMYDSSLLQEWGFDGTVNEIMITVFSPEQIEIIKD